MTEAEADLFWEAAKGGAAWMELADVQLVLKELASRPGAAATLRALVPQLLSNLAWGADGPLWEDCDMPPMNAEWHAYHLDLLREIGSSARSYLPKVVAELDVETCASESWNGYSWLAAIVEGLRAIGCDASDLDLLWRQLDRSGVTRETQESAGRPKAV